jgi:hypothetical protein
MANENLSDLTTADILELVQANPGLIPQIANFDPRIKLLETLYKKPEHRKMLKAMTKEHFPTAEIAEVDLPAEYEAKLLERDKKITALEKRLDDGEQGTRYSRFRGALRTHAEALDEAPDDKALDEIIAFMKDNDYGEKSAAVAVGKFYETKALATPNLTAGNPLAPATGDAYVTKLFKAGPSDDLMALAMPDIERIFHEEFTGSPTQRRPQMA